MSSVDSRIGEARGRESLRRTFNLFTTTCSLDSCGRPIVIAKYSNMNAGARVLFRLSVIRATNGSLITVGIGSVLAANNSPLLFLSCLNVSGLRQRHSHVAHLITNVYSCLRSYGYVLTKKRATRVPNIIPRSVIRLSNFYVNYYRGDGLVSPGAIQPKSMFVNCGSSDFRTGN